MVATAARLSAALARGGCDLALNLGVCGSFDPMLPPGTVVHVTSDRLAELGAEDGETVLDLTTLGLAGDDGIAHGGDTIVNDAPPSLPALTRLPCVRGITVNTVHGCETSIAAVRARCAPQVESMEGAAFMYACRLHGVPFAQVRAVSNIVERRNRGAWRLQDAIARLADVAADILDLR
jgi:futalosine hydrolase